MTVSPERKAVSEVQLKEVYVSLNQKISQKLDNFVVSEEEPAEATEGIIWVKPAATTTGAVDYIVEQGISGIWMYRKWNSGIAECWGTVSFNATVDTAQGSLNVAAGPGRQNYPFTFVNPPREIATLHPTQVASFLYAESAGNGITTTTQTANYSIAKGGPAVTTSYPFAIDYYVVGQWK